MNCESLQKAANEFAVSNFRDLSSHEEFLNLSCARLVKLVSSDKLEVPREEDVFTAVLKWLNHQPDARKKDFHRVLENVGLLLMSPSFLHDCVSKQEIIQTSTECQALLQKALWYQLMPDRRVNMQGVRTRPRREGTLVDVIVCVGGYDGQSELSCVEAFDPVSNQWTSLCDLPFGVSGHGAAVTGNNVLYISRGLINPVSTSNHLLRFDPQANQWEEKAGMRWCPEHELAGIAALNQFLYAVGGDRGGSFARYNTEANTWEQLPDLPTGVYWGATVLTHDGYIYVVGGYRDDGNRISCVQRFDPCTRAWADMASMQIGRCGSAGCVIDGKLYIIGGLTDNRETTNKVECYDIRNNWWSSCSPMRVGREDLGVVVLGGHIYVLGGDDNDGTTLNSVERYTPATDRWEDVPEMAMTSPCSDLTCIALHVPRSLLDSGKRWLADSL